MLTHRNTVLGAESEALGETQKDISPAPVGLLKDPPLRRRASQMPSTMANNRGSFPKEAECLHGEMEPSRRVLIVCYMKAFPGYFDVLGP